MRETSETKRNPQVMRTVQLIVFISGIAMIITGAYLLSYAAEEGDSTRTLIGGVLIAAGFGDLVIAFVVFRGAGDRGAERPHGIRERKRRF